MLGSGCSMSTIVQDTVAAGLSGFEYHYGLPGTLGGAIYMNSKWTHPFSYVGDHLLIATVMDRDGTIREECRDYFEFAYDYCKLQDTGELFLEGVFRLMRHDSKELRKRTEEVSCYRKETQPFGVATGGCFFQNISEAEQKKSGLSSRSVGYLIDEAGLKGKRKGDFYISDKHANFIINAGKGKPEDLQMLIDEIKDVIRKKYGIELREEVQIIHS